MMKGPNEVGNTVARRLTVAQLDERMDELARELAAGLGADRERDRRPVWVAPARWVRLMEPFVSRN